MTRFPKDPEPGMVFELKPGILYVYDQALKSWRRLEGGMPIPATPTSDGTMTADDLKKLNRLVLPPPQSTLTVEGAAASFDGGIVSLREGDKYLSIDDNGPLMNKVAGIDDDSSRSIGRQLHQHTYSFDLTIDTSTLLTHMVDSGKLSVRTQRGLQGPQGNRGADGVDDLTFGPDGPQGLPGSNAGFELTLQAEQIQFERKRDVHRAITKVETEEVSLDENYLVLTRANIGNPNACPPILRLGADVESPWVACVPDHATNASITWSRGDCLLCGGQVYYLDMTEILEAIKDEFEKEVRDIKHDMEQITAFWLTIMSGLFDEQKAALCCALEYCKSQTRNAQTRQYIEQSRISAAQTQTPVGEEFTFDDEGVQTGKTISSKGHSIVIDGDPLNSGESAVVKEIMDPACEPGGFGTSNKNNLPNNADPIGGSQCVPGVAIVDGGSVDYDDCPPGFIPRDFWRDHSKGVAYSGEPRTYPANYSETPSVYENLPPGAIPGVSYSPYGPSVSGKGIDAKRSSDPSTQCSLRVTIQADTQEERTDVFVSIKSVDGKVGYVSGYTERDGLAIFHNLSTTDRYLIEVLKPGFTFDPPAWTNLLFNAGEQKEITTEVTDTDGSVSTRPYAQRTCGSGSNDIHVRVNGANDDVRMAYIRVFNYWNGMYVCGAQASPSGEIRFRGIGSGKYVLLASRPPIGGQTFTVTPSCDTPPAIGGPGWLEAIRKCTQISFDASQNHQVATAIFSVSATASISPMSLGKVEIVLPNDVRYEKLVEVQTKSRGLTRAVELHLSAGGYVLSKTSDLSTLPDDSAKKLDHRSGAVDRFNGDLTPGIHTICVTNESGVRGGFRLCVASLNAKIVQGSGNGWDDKFIRAAHNEDALEWPGSTVAESASGPVPGDSWWLQLRVLPAHGLEPPYKKSCGAVGPSSTEIDSRLCREIPADHGGYKEWTTSDCNGKVLPDALRISLGGQMAPADQTVLCRSGDGNYIGGFDLDGSSARITLSQLEPVAVTRRSNLELFVQDPPKGIGGDRFQCALMVWDGDCGSEPAHHSAMTIIADCEPFSISGEWDIDGTPVTFTAVGVDNLDDGAQSSHGLKLVLDSAEPNGNKSASAELPKGTYIVDIAGCCMKSGEQYTGHAEVEYSVLGSPYIKRFPNLGAGRDEYGTRAAYLGLTLEIEHSGGPVIARLATPILSGADGSITIRFTPKSFVDPMSRVVVPQSIPNDSCHVHSGLLKWYKEGWAKGDCIGVVVNVVGQDYIVMYREGDGGTPCPGKFSKPALAWPTFDGKEFAGLPESGSVIFKVDAKLDGLVKSALAVGKYDNACGDVSTIDVVLFPTTRQ